MIVTKRAYDQAEPGDGVRILVDRLWPRGIKKEELEIDDWLKDVGPSNELRKWFKHEGGKWESFVEKYLKELDANKASWEPLLNKAKHHRLTLIYSAKDVERNNAVALKQYLDLKLTPGAKR